MNEASHLPADRVKKQVILVVEDDPPSRILVADILRAGDFDVREAEDGQHALELFESAPRQDSFSAVVTDVMMPRLDGLALSKQLRKLSPDLPIVLLTGLNDKETIKQALRLGVSEFIEKPLNPTLLLDCVRRVISESPRPHERERQRETAEAVQRTQAVLLAQAGEGFPLEIYSEPYKDAGGDVFRCLPESRGACLFVLVDVAGHSVESSYAVASFLGMFAAHSASDDSLVEMLRKLNASIQLGPFPDIAVCVLLGRWRPRTGRLHLANVGLPHVLHFRSRHGDTTTIPLDGTPLGLFPEPLVDERVLILEEGDRLLLATDGLFDAASREGEVFEHQVERYWETLSGAPLREALASLGCSARAWADNGLTDDLLMVGLDQPRVEGLPGELRMDFDSTLGQVDVACSELKNFLGANGSAVHMDEKRSFEVVAAVREALSNGVIHGNRDKPLARLGLRCWIPTAPHRLSVAVTDEGSGFDLKPAGAPEGDLQEGKRGIPLMLALSDEFVAIPGETKLIFDL